MLLMQVPYFYCCGFTWQKFGHGSKIQFVSAKLAKTIRLVWVLNQMPPIQYSVRKSGPICLKPAFQFQFIGLKRNLHFSFKFIGLQQPKFPISSKFANVFFFLISFFFIIFICLPLEQNLKIFWVSCEWRRDFNITEINYSFINANPKYI